MAIPNVAGGFNSDHQDLFSAISSVAITAVHGGSDQTLTKAGRGLYVGVAGNLVCTLVGDSAASTFTGLLAGAWYPFAIASITATNTTITNSLILY